MSNSKLEHEPVEFERPPYSGRFVLLIVLLAFATLVLQAGLVVLSLSDSWLSAQRLATGSGVLVFTQNATVLSGSTAVWNEELWVSVIAGQLMSSPTKVRAPSSRLVAIDLKTGNLRETGIALSPAPVGILVHDDVLWVVSETVVHSIQNQQAVPRHPRRSLNEPTKPFVYQGRLAVVDKNRNDVYTLLTWHDGEWWEEGQIEVPSRANPTPWVTPELRVISNGDALVLVYSDGQNVVYREGIVFISASDPVSALAPENVKSLATGVMTVSHGWQSAPFPANWSSAWEVAIVDNELCAFALATPYSSSAIQQYTHRNGTWQNVTPRYTVETTSFGVTPGSPSYLVTGELHLFQAHGVNLTRVTTGISISERMNSLLPIFGWFVRDLIVTGTLVLGTGWLMQVYRRPEYLYGKRTMIQASLFRRAAARGIDSLISIFPVVFWFWVVIKSENDIQQQLSFTGIRSPMVFLLFSLLGMWLGIVLVFSYLEGRCGFTPGKWLLGIRTLRTTLRPCGMLRALARELLIYVDGVFLITWLPGVLLIALTPHQQRIGDLTSDTVVVQAAKIKTEFPNP